MPNNRTGRVQESRTCDHLQTMKVSIDKANEYNFPLYTGFEKVFDSVELWANQNSLQKGTTDYRYTGSITNIYKNATSP